ncbi:DUF2218 domain-containing protein [Photobacterium galatheae]|uniref:2,4-dihydroxyhept-2-ene-1,7-dioic acid aldolase n=1 Tax=Photobacterium galatheae TaxID=1654360 RepID=A0A066RWW5_9GAMM|nr:DUF2218 domain-containing protein [Photobacterium galatheae]KDM91888.1 hypothetical protein EA58_09165 [Photobacterium galatheae]MCM0147699.1 DUF2218 domain-containing protein [Photobacterium galatheae]
MNHHVTTQIQTPDGSKYLRHLCKHFNHKVQAEWDDQQGRVFFDMGTCAFHATESMLTIECQAASDEALEVVKDIVKSHFDRFARREAVELTWGTTG